MIEKPRLNFLTQSTTFYDLPVSRNLQSKAKIRHFGGWRTEGLSAGLSQGYSIYRLRFAARCCSNSKYRTRKVLLFIPTTTKPKWQDAGYGNLVNIRSISYFQVATWVTSIYQAWVMFSLTISYSSSPLAKVFAQKSPPSMQKSTGKERIRIRILQIASVSRWRSKI